jgi:hypothetical protein
VTFPEARVPRRQRSRAGILFGMRDETYEADRLYVMSYIDVEKMTVKIALLKLNVFASGRSE